MDVQLMQFNQLTPEEQQVFNNYKSSSFTFNTNIREGNISQEVVTLDTLIERYECVQPMILYRALPLHSFRLSENNTKYQDLSYLSCSVEKDSVYNFCTENQMVILEISCLVGINMINMSINPIFGDTEEEFLLPRNLPLNLDRSINMTDYNDILRYCDDDPYIAGGMSRLLVCKLSSIS
jgi:hypothetical protein